MVGWHHQLNGHEFEQAPRVGGGQKPDELQPMGSQRVEHNLVTEQRQMGLIKTHANIFCMMMQMMIISIIIHYQHSCLLEGL